MWARQKEPDRMTLKDLPVGRTFTIPNDPEVYTKIDVQLVPTYCTAKRGDEPCYVSPYLEIIPGPRA